VFPRSAGSGKQKAHHGQIEEAKQLAATRFRNTSPTRAGGGSEQLITQLAQTLREEKAAAVPRPLSTGSARICLLRTRGHRLRRQTGRRARPPPRTPRRSKTPPLPRRDFFFAKAELARLRRQPEEEKNIAQIAEGFNPESLSPLLLGKAGDYLHGQGQTRSRVGLL
jgi:hypothetical protein